MFFLSMEKWYVFLANGRSKELKPKPRAWSLPPVPSKAPVLRDPRDPPGPPRSSKPVAATTVPPWAVPSCGIGESIWKKGGRYSQVVLFSWNAMENIWIFCSDCFFLHVNVFVPIIIMAFWMSFDQPVWVRIVGRIQRRLFFAKTWTQ